MTSHLDKEGKYLTLEDQNFSRALLHPQLYRQHLATPIKAPETRLSHGFGTK